MVKRMLVCFSAATAMLLSGCGPTKTPAYIDESVSSRISKEDIKHLDKLYKQVRGAVVKVMSRLKKETGELGPAIHMGSGVIIIGNKVLTARHVVEAEDWDGLDYIVSFVDIPVAFNEEGSPLRFERYEVTGWSVAEKDTYTFLDGDTDLALLTIKVKEGETLPFIKFAEKNPLIGEDVFTVGFPLSMDLVVTAGVVSQYSFITYWGAGWKLDNPVYCMGYDAHTAPGSSGGPVFDWQGNLVAIHVAGVRSYAGYHWGVPISDVYKFVNGLNGLSGLNKE